MKKPYIAKDTKQPLVVMGGYKIDQDGGIIHDTIPLDSKKPTATADDEALLAKHGYAELVDMGFWGVIDRLKTSGLINNNGGKND